jgi:hypothetical protein
MDIGAVSPKPSLLSMIEKRSGQRWGVKKLFISLRR